MTYVVLISICIVIALVAHGRTGKLAADGKIICTDCGSRMNKPQSKTPGSLLIELVLWLCLILPGLIYSLWRHSRRQGACVACGSTKLIPITTPQGKALAEKHAGLAQA